MNWVAAALPYVGGGLLGAGLTYALTWVRERRRTLDAYRAPQRQAIGEIVTAAHQFLMREVETRFLFTEFIGHLRHRPDEIPPNGDQVLPSMGVMQAALLDVERAFQIGALAIVDARCWEALGIAYTELTRLRNYFISEAEREFSNPDELDQYIGSMKQLANELDESVSALVRAAVDRVSPPESRLNLLRRQRARHRLGQRYL
jgi:hypothetical protein